jgi:hypothetical protein
LDFLGLSAQSKKSTSFSIKDVMVNLGLDSNIYGGIFNFTGPFLSLTGGPASTAKVNEGFVGGRIEGTINVDRTTGKLTLDSHINTNNAYPVRFTVGADHKIPVNESSTLGVEVERAIDATRTAHTLNNSTFMTAYDSIGLIYDTTASEDRYYLTVGAKVYLLGGVSNLAAEAVRALVKANIPAGQLGHFSVGFDVYKVVNNPAKDPFYGTGVSAGIIADWKKTLNGLGYRNQDPTASLTFRAGAGNPMQPVGVIGNTVISPEFSGNKFRSLMGQLSFPL